MSSTRNLTGIDTGAGGRFRLLGPTGGAAGAVWVRLAISNPPGNPAPPNRLSAANSREPVLPGRNRFWSTCIHTNRSVSGELLVYRICSVAESRFSAVSRVALMV